MQYKSLLSPMKIGSCKIKNRVVMPPMHLGMANINGTPTENFMNYYEERAKGGVGLIITEITRINDWHGATSFRQPSMSHDYNIEPMRKFVKRIHKHGAKLFVQLHHPGRQNLGIMINSIPLGIASTKILPSFETPLFKLANKFGKPLDEKQITFKTVAPSKCEQSAVANSKIRELKNKEIKELIQEFIDAAIRCKTAGVDGIEIHASHGYLIQQFLSPNTNKRTDEYGGSFRKRLRFLREIIEGIRQHCGDEYPIIVRLTVDECYDRIGQPEKGYGIEMGVKYAKAIEKMGVDAIDVSSASYDTYNYWLEPTSFDVGWRTYMAEAVKKEVSIPVIAANLIRSAEQAENQINSGIQDFVALGRPHIADPNWVNKVSEGNENEVKRCIGCLYCMQSTLDGAFKGERGGCAVNPSMGREKKFNKLKKDGNGRTIVIVGAGVAGLTAAEILGRRGFNPIVLEKSHQIGGQIQLANKPPKKEKMGWCFEDLEVNAKKYGATIYTNTIADQEKIASFNPYAVIIATGCIATKPKFIDGADRENVFTTTDILSGKVNLSDKNVAVVGSGLTGIETSELLVEQGNKVTVIEMEDEIAPVAWFQHKIDILPKLESAGTRFITSSKLCKINEESIVLENLKNKQQNIVQFDAVVISLGPKPVNDLYDTLKTTYEKLHLIGDANKVANIAAATNDAYIVATENI